MGRNLNSIYRQSAARLSLCLPVGFMLLRILLYCAREEMSNSEGYSVNLPIVYRIVRTACARACTARWIFIIFNYAIVREYEEFSVCNNRMIMLRTFCREVIAPVQNAPSCVWRTMRVQPCTNRTPTSRGPVSETMFNTLVPRQSSCTLRVLFSRTHFSRLWETRDLTSRYQDVSGAMREPAGVAG